MRSVFAFLISLLVIAGCQTPGEITPDDMSCGTPDGKGHVWTLDIQQHPHVKEPSYYYLGDGHVVLLSQDAVRSYVQNLSAHYLERANTEMLRFVREIQTAPKLQSYQDLYVYALPDGYLWSEVLHLVVDLILKGQATIVDPGGTPREKVVAVREKGQGYSRTTIRIGNERGPRILTRFECIT
jgi:hypothetical protein